MANYRAIAAGNWNTGSTWDGGSVPPNSAGHNVYTNGFVVTIDTSVNVNLITNTAITASFVGGGTSAAIGGGFTVSSTGFTITATLTGASATSQSLLNFSAAFPATLTVNGASISAGSATASHGVLNSSTGTITVNSSSLVATNQANACLYNAAGGSFIVNGAIFTNGINAAYTITNASTGSISVTNSTLTSNATSSFCINNTSSGSVSVTNSTITGGGIGTSPSINQTSSGSITISGCAINAGATSVGIAAGTGTLTCSGCTFTATNAASAISGTGTIRLSGTFISATNGQQAVNASRWILNTAPTASYIQQALDGINAGSYVRFYTSDNNPNGGVAATDVRLGVSYGGGLVGTCAVPNAGTVAFGVAVDNTTGTATLTASNVRAALGLASANLDSQLASLPTAATNATAVWGAATRTITGGTVDTLTNAPASVTPSDIWSHAARTLTSASGPSATDIRQELDTNSTKLANLDATISSRLASSVSTNITAIKAKTDLLNTDRLAQCATTSIVGNLIAQSNS